MSTENQVYGTAGTADLMLIEPGTTLEAWLLALPGQHPLWDHYMLAIIHLRDVEGMPPARKVAAHMEHEIIMLALDPERNPSPTDRETIVPLMPVNYSDQLSQLTDEQAVVMTRLMVRGFVNGALFAEPSGIQGVRDIWWAYLHDAIEKAKGLQDD